MTTSQITAGTTFTRRDARPYTIDGVKRTHVVVTRNVVTGVNAVGFDFKATEVVEETDRPDFAGDASRGAGSMAWFGFEAAIARGDVKVD